jgi:hypothetical protein
MLKMKGNVDQNTKTKVFKQRCTCKKVAPRLDEAREKIVKKNF